MGNAILASEVFGLIALAIIMYGAWFESKERSRKKKSFMVLVAAVFITLCVDAVSYLPLDWESMYTYHYSITLAAFVCPLFVYALFLQYIYLHASTRVQMSRTLFGIGIVYCILGCVLCVVFGMMGKLFVIEHGAYQPGEYYEFYLAAYVIVLTYTILIICIKVKSIGLHDAIGAVMFMLVPIIFIVINIINSEYAFSVSSLSISMMIINTMLQAERENRLIENEAASAKLAHYDELTGLLNRLAYNETCDKMRNNSSSTVGVVFADVNGLKYTNDHFGHKAGDDLLCEFATTLLSCFRREDVFRISGDEFVVLISGINKELFDRKTQSLVEKIKERDIPIASIGYVHGSEPEISKLLDMAESKMYVSKKEFHRMYPNYDRVSVKK